MKNIVIPILITLALCSCSNNNSSNTSNAANAANDTSYADTTLRPEGMINSNYQNAQFIDWFNKSWYANGTHPAKLEPFNGYIAPPLDGVWITAPYLHNGSVPTLEALLNSNLRPRYWQRDFTNMDYDYENVGWKYKIKDNAGDKNKTVHNTE